MGIAPWADKGARARVREIRLSGGMVLCAASVLGVAMMLMGMWIGFPS